MDFMDPVKDQGKQKDIRAKHLEAGLKEGGSLGSFCNKTKNEKVLVKPGKKSKIHHKKSKTGILEGITMKNTYLYIPFLPCFS